MADLITFDAATHTYTRSDGKEIPSVSSIIGILTADHYGSINPSVMEAAARRGTMVHEELESVDYDCFDGLAPYEISGYIEAYLDFLRTYDVDWHGVEQIVYEPIANYCGTVDRYGTIDGQLCVVDIKTYAQPTRENYMALMAQTAAYEDALRCMDKLPQIDQVKNYGLFLRKDGTFRLVDCAEYAKKFEQNGREIFTRCWEFYNWKVRTLERGKRKK